MNYLQPSVLHAEPSTPRHDRSRRRWGGGDDRRASRCPHPPCPTSWLGERPSPPPTCPWYCMLSSLQGVSETQVSSCGTVRGRVSTRITESNGKSWGLLDPNPVPSLSIKPGFLTPDPLRGLQCSPTGGGMACSVPASQGSLTLASKQGRAPAMMCLKRVGFTSQLHVILT